MFRRVAALLLIALPGGVAFAAEWSDVEGRIEFAWYTEDLRALRGVIGTLPRADAAGDQDGALREYYLGLGYYRVALLTQARDKGSSRAAAEDCVGHLDRALDAHGDFADALGLQAACMKLLATLKPWKSPLLGARSGAQIERALALAPRNPRVLLFGAALDGDPGRAFATLGKAVAAFEAERQGVAPLPAWGAPEAYLQLARSAFGRGDAAAARSALERALLLSPEFTAARRLLATLTAG
ncbi:MAG: hypothetical protein AB7G76_05535 [Steroidobacteraceae bacterium]